MRQFRRCRWPRCGGLNVPPSIPVLILQERSCACPHRSTDGRQRTSSRCTVQHPRRSPRRAPRYRARREHRTLEHLALDQLVGLEQRVQLALDRLGHAPSLPMIRVTASGFASARSCARCFVLSMYFLLEISYILSFSTSPQPAERTRGAKCGSSPRARAHRTCTLIPAHRTADRSRKSPSAVVS